MLSGPSIEPCAGFPRSWNILKFETILESHEKVINLCLFSRSHGKLICQGESHGKNPNHLVPNVFTSQIYVFSMNPAWAFLKVACFRL